MIRDLRPPTDKTTFMRWRISPSLIKESNQTENSSDDHGFHGSWIPNHDLIEKNAEQTSMNIVEKMMESESRRPRGVRRSRSMSMDRNLNSRELLSEMMSTKAERCVHRWLQNALPLDRTAALKALSQLSLEHRPVERNKQFEELVQTLHKKSDRSPHPVFSKTDGLCHLKYLNLLKPNERRDRWMYTTWHHLPPHQISVEAANRDNCGSHYAKLRKHFPPDYVIHPDMDWN